MDTRLTVVFSGFVLLPLSVALLGGSPGGCGVRVRSSDTRAMTMILMVAATINANNPIFEAIANPHLIFDFRTFKNCLLLGRSMANSFL